MTCTTYEFALGAGFDNGTLTNIETITASGDSKPFYPPYEQNYSGKQTVLRGDYGSTGEGAETTEWLFGWFTQSQLAHMKTTYCNDTFAGTVTVKTTTGGTTYTTRNAWMRLSEPSEAQRNYTAYPDYVIRFILLDEVS